MFTVLYALPLLRFGNLPLCVAAYALFTPFCVGCHVFFMCSLDWRSFSNLLRSAVLWSLACNMVVAFQVVFSLFPLQLTFPGLCWALVNWDGLRIWVMGNVFSDG